MKNAVLGAKSQAKALPVARGVLSQVRNFGLAVEVLAVGAAQIAVTQRQLVGGLVVDEGAPALPPAEKALRLHHVEGLAHGAGADTELTRQVALVGNGGARLPGAR